MNEQKTISFYIPSHLHMFDILNLVSLTGHTNEKIIINGVEYLEGSLYCEGIKHMIIYFTILSHNWKNIYPSKDFVLINDLKLIQEFK